jgi:hypothetical protein
VAWRIGGVWLHARRLIITGSSSLIVGNEVMFGLIYWAVILGNTVDIWILLCTFTIVSSGVGGIRGVCMQSFRYIG